MTEKEKKFAVARIKEELAVMFNTDDDVVKELDNTRAEDLDSFCIKNEIEGLRFCTKCGKPMCEGFLTIDSDPYCSAECLEMSDQEIEDQYSNEDDCIFWTEWNY